METRDTRPLTERDEMLMNLLDGDIYRVQSEAIKAKIEQRRRQIMVHSYIYYEMDDSLVSDAQWSQWAKELVWLTQEFPDIAKECVYSKEFDGFEGSTGFDFKYPENIKNRAAKLIAHKDMPLLNSDIYIAHKNEEVSL